VFGILERDGRVAVTVVPNCSAETLVTETLKTVKRGSLVYTDKWSGYDTLTFCGYRHLKVDHGRAVRAREGAHQRARRLLELRQSQVHQAPRA
jgi:transposase-like protein